MEKQLIFVCIVFSFFSEIVDRTIKSVFDQNYPHLGLVIIDNGCPGFDSVLVAEKIRQYKQNKSVKVIIHNNTKRIGDDEVRWLCAEKAGDYPFIVLKNGECFADKNAISRLMKNNALSNSQITISANDKSTDMDVDNDVILGKLNYSRSIRLKTFINRLINSWMSQKKRHRIEEEINHELLDTTARFIGSQWDIPESERTYLQYLQRITELLNMTDTMSTIERIKQKHLLEILLNKAIKTAEQKVKIVFFAQEYSVWPSLQSLYVACSQDERFIAQLVYIPFPYDDKEPSKHDNKEMEHYWKAGFDIMPYTMYDCAAESPDIAVFVKPYDMVPQRFTVGQINKVVRRMVYVPYGLFTAAGKTYSEYQHGLPLMAGAWKIIADSQVFIEESKVFGMRDGENVIVSGNPRMDLYQNKVAIFPELWLDKTNGKKVFLYNTHHSVEDGEGYGTFFMYYKKLFEHFNAQENSVLLWRPHPLLKKVLIENEYISEFEWDEIVQNAQASKSIIVDFSPSYLPAMFFADAMITDGTTLMKEYILTDRPLIYTKKDSINYIDDPILISACSVAHDFEDIIIFCEKVLCGIDEKKAMRKKYFESTFINFGRNVGKLIADELYSCMENEEKALI